jgi:6-phosphogluconolactonase
VKKDPLKLFFIGTYTDGRSKGIYKSYLNTLTGKLSEPALAVSSENPSYLTLSEDKNFLLAVNEKVSDGCNKNGIVESFAINQDGEKLIRISRVTSGGEHPCYLSVNPYGFVVVANYTGGSVALLSLDEEGFLKFNDLKHHLGNGPFKERQEKAHVHSAIFDPLTNRIFVADLGTDKINIYNLDRLLQRFVPATYPEIKLPSGSGPRHMIFTPSNELLYVACELSNTVTVWDMSNHGIYSMISCTSTLPKDFKGENYAADIKMTQDRRFLYVSNRGMNTVAIFSIDKNNEELKLISQVPVKGQYPRYLVLSPEEDYLLVANQKSQNIVVFKRDRKTGELIYSDKVNAFTPVCLLFQN